MTTPLPINNPPGRDALRYRVGRYGDFRQSMLARLADPAALFTPLNVLRTRAPDDPTIAFLDAFAAVGEVLTFYQERLANEGYIRTAVEDRSVAELARLTGYRPKAGLASNVYLAFTVDPASQVTVPAGARAQSVPGPGQKAQSFETGADLFASGAWNALKPRLSQPTQADADLERFYAGGLSTNLKPNDPVLLVVDGAPVLRRVDAVTTQPDRQRTLVTLQPRPAPPPPNGTSNAREAKAPPTSEELAAATAIPTPDAVVVTAVRELAASAALPPAMNPSDPTALERGRSTLTANSDAALALAAGADWASRRPVYRALAQQLITSAPKLEVHAFRSATAPSGARAPPRSVDANGRVLATPEEWSLSEQTFGPASRLSIAVSWALRGAEATPVALMREAAASHGAIQVQSKLAYKGAELTLIVAGSADATDSGALGEVGQVVCTLRQLDETGIVLVFEFTDQPVALLVSISADGPASAANGIDSPALTQIAATASLQARRLEVTGELALRTGMTSLETPTVLYLDGVFDTITPGSWVVFDVPTEEGPPPTPAKVAAAGVSTVSRVAYGQTARVTRLALETPWIDPGRATFQGAIRDTAVYANSTPLVLAEEDIDDPITPASPSLELDGFAPGLAAGRWLVVTGERTDLPGSTSAEVAMLAGATHGGASGLDGETVHTTLTFAAPLAYGYKRDTVTILANVAKASQGESVDEVLGSGSGAFLNQVFPLKKPPLTYVSAATTTGRASTLNVYVNGVAWSEVDSFNEAGAADHVFVTEPTADGGTAVRFGDGIRGARLPTGSGNVRARYRSGLGSSGNVDGGAISTLLSRPLGLKAVANPLPASGGADAEPADAIRRNAALGLVSLFRLVSVRDYEDFSRAFAGIAKASAARFAGPDGPLVHVTIAGADDDALDASSDLWSALQGALDGFGDAETEVEIAACAAKLAIVSAAIAIDADRLWSNVEPAVRARLLDRFGFPNRDLGQSLYASDVIAAIQAVPGVSYVDLRLLSSVAAPADADAVQNAVEGGSVEVTPARLARVGESAGARTIIPAEIVYLSDALPDMLVLSEIGA